MDIGNLPEKEFRVLIIKTIKELMSRMYAHSKKLEFLTKRKNIKTLLDPIEPDLAQQGFSKIARLV